MRKALLDVIFASGKREDALLLLRNKSMEMENILAHLDTTRQALLPQIKILEDHHLVSHKNDFYQLTTIGKLVADEMVSLVDKTEVLGVNLQYWGTHKLDFIPPHLFKRIDEIKECTITEPNLVDAYEVNRDFMEEAFKCSSLYFVFNFMHPSFPLIMQQFIDSDIDISLIVSTEMLQKLKSNWKEVTEKFIASGKMKYYVYNKEVNILSLSINDSCFILRLLSKDNVFCNKQLSCCTPKAHQWGKELFDHYLKDSTLISKL